MITGLDYDSFFGCSGFDVHRLGSFVLDTFSNGLSIPTNDTRDISLHKQSHSSLSPAPI